MKFNLVMYINASRDCRLSKRWEMNGFYFINYELESGIEIQILDRSR